MDELIAKIVSVTAKQIVVSLFDGGRRTLPKPVDPAVLQQIAQARRRGDTVRIYLVDGQIDEVFLGD